MKLLTPAAWNYGHSEHVLPDFTISHLPTDYRIPARLGWEACSWENFTQGKQWRLERGIEIESSQK